MGRPAGPAMHHGTRASLFRSGVGHTGRERSLPCTAGNSPVTPGKFLPLSSPHLLLCKVDAVRINEVTRLRRLRSQCGAEVGYDGPVQTSQLPCKLGI